MSEYEDFRMFVREWFRKNAPSELRMRRFTEMDDPRYLDIAIKWHRKLYEAGLVGISWPREYGGLGDDIRKELIIRDEALRAGVVYPGCPGLGLSVAGPAILFHGTEEQKSLYIRRILTCEDIWAQGFSEPQAGSDLAGITTRAEDRGDYFVITGQKVWSSAFHLANYYLLLARTGTVEERHRGLTMFIVDTRSEGITYKPIRQINGRSGFSAVFLDGVKVPKSNVVGKVGEGWRVAMTTLNFERLNIGGYFVYAAEALARKLVEYTRDPDSIALLEEALALKKLYERMLTRALMGQAVGPEASSIKLIGSELIERINVAAVSKLGPEVLVEGDLFDWAFGYIDSKSYTIFSGTSEILRNLLGELVLGLPKG
jgi:alkylation response protein AidB-like acyl-CoA dehydrogenase